MQQTIQFDPSTDPVSTVLLQVARAYGFTGITEAMASNGKPVGIYPTRKPQVAYKPLEEIAWGPADGVPLKTPDPEPDPEMEIPDSQDEYTFPWSTERVQEFLLHLTGSAQRALALLVVKGEVELDEMRTYLRTRSLQGVFSTVGSAIRNTRDLPKTARPYSRLRTPKRMYRMEPPVQRVFRAAFEGNPRIKYCLDQAAEYVASMGGSR